MKYTQGPLDQAGFSITGSQRVAVMRSYSHDNGGPGILILVQDATPNTDIVVESSQFNNNGEEGILLSSGVDGNVSTRVAILGVQALNNAWDGILVEAGNQVTIADTEVGYSGIAGIRIDNVPIVANGFPRATVIQITNPNVHDSGRLVGIPESGIGLNGAQQVSIAGGRVSRTGTLIEGYGIGLYRNKYGLASDYVNIKGVDATIGVQSPPVATIDESGVFDSGAAVQHGYYELSAYGPPDGVLFAPVGSVYYDLSGHALYQKQSGWNTTVWVLIQVI